MINENEEQIATLSHTAEAEETKGEKNEAISLGKFKDVNALLSAYDSLQAEFTKRSQRLRELEGKASSDKVERKEENSEKFRSVPDGAEEKHENAESINETLKSEILKEYLKSVIGAKQTAVVMDGAGVGVRTPADRPKSISEAGELAKKLLSSE